MGGSLEFHALMAEDLKYVIFKFMGENKFVEIQAVQIK